AGARDAHRAGRLGRSRHRHRDRRRLAPAAAAVARARPYELVLLQALRDLRPEALSRRVDRGPRTVEEKLAGRGAADAAEERARLRTPGPDGRLVAPGEAAVARARDHRNEVVTAELRLDQEGENRLASGRDGAARAGRHRRGARRVALGDKALRKSLERRS